jgi:PEGA domain
LLWELLAGVPPFRGASATHVLAAHILEPAPRLPRSGPHGRIPRRLGRLLARMMAKRPQDRPDGMEEVVAELEAVLSPASPKASWLVGGLALLAVLSAASALSVWVTRHRPRPAAAASLARASPAAPAAATTTPAPAAGLGLLPQSESATAPMRAPSPVKVLVTVLSEPPGASVALEGRLLGVTPLKLPLATGVPVRLELSLPGYLSESRVLRPRGGLNVDVRLAAVPRPTFPDLKDSPY